MPDNLNDRIDGAADKMTGSVKEAAGKAADDKQLEGEGKLDQAKGEGKDVIANLKDKVNNLLGGDNKD